MAGSGCGCGCGRLWGQLRGKGRGVQAAPQRCLIAPEGTERPVRGHDGPLQEELPVRLARAVGGQGVHHDVALREDAPRLQLQRRVQACAERQRRAEGGGSARREPVRAKVEGNAGLNEPLAAALVGARGVPL